MPYLKQTPWLDIKVEEDPTRVTIEQRWKVSWKNDPGASPWTEKEKSHSYHKAQKVIKNSWGRAFKIHVKGTSDFARRNLNNTFPVSFNIYNTAINWHWNVKAIKIKPGFSMISYTTWGTRELEIHQHDVKMERTPSARQRVIAHEVGHTLGILDDEYTKFNEFYADKQSIMHNGMIIRNRHLNFILSEINTIIPDTHFYL